KTVDRSILRLETRDSPRTVSTGETPLLEISKAVAPHDTKVLFGRFPGILLFLGESVIFESKSMLLKLNHFRVGSGSCRGIDSTSALLNEYRAHCLVEWGHRQLARRES